MNNSMDDFIKKKFEEDNYIPPKVNAVFEDFKKNKIKYINNSNNIIQLNESKNNYYNINQTSKQQNNQNGKISSFFTYKNMNKFLSVAAVFLCVVLVGMGTLLKNRPTEIEKIDIITKSVSVKNEELMFSNEEVIKYSENNLVKASIIGNKKVAIQLKENFINLYNLNLSPEKQYEVTNINKNVKDVFVGYMISFDTPYVLLVMEDGTAECIQILYDTVVPMNNYEFYFFSQGKIAGLYDVVGFEQRKRSYTNKEGFYYYINAIREDGKKKEIELGYYNNWDDNSTKIYDSLNVSNKLENANNNVSNNEINKIEDVNDNENNKIDNNENKGVNNSIEVNDSSDKINTENTNMNNQSSTNKESYLEENNKLSEMNPEYYRCSRGFYCLRKLDDLDNAYYVDENKLYRVNISKDEYTCMANGVFDVSFNQNNELIAKLKNEYTIYENDTNIVYAECDVSVTNIIEQHEDYFLHLYVKQDGSLNVRILENGLKELGLEGKTNLKEDIIYNIMPASGDESVQVEFPSANAQRAIIGKVGLSQRLSIVYYNTEKEIVTIDIMETIMKSDFGNARAAAVFDIPNCKGFEISEANTVLNGKQLPPYDSIFAIVEINGKEEKVQAAWCE